jgi:AraC-like DNA-binding protein
VGGLHTRAAPVAHDGEQQGISVDLTPLGARAVAGAPGWPARFAVIDDALSRGLRPSDGPGDGVARAWHLMLTRPDLEMRALAREVGWSRRHLSERVRDEVGPPPRRLARVIRFERSVEALGRRSSRRWARSRSGPGTTTTPTCSTRDTTSPVARPGSGSARKSSPRYKTPWGRGRGLSP